jgi:hypothetical protein
VRLRVHVYIFTLRLQKPAYITGPGSLCYRDRVVKDAASCSSCMSTDDQQHYRWALILPLVSRLTLPVALLNYAVSERTTSTGFPWRASVRPCLVSGISQARDAQLDGRTSWTNVRLVEVGQLMGIGVVWLVMRVSHSPLVS